MLCVLLEYFINFMVLPVIFMCSEHVFIVDMGQYVDMSFYHVIHYKFQSHQLIEYHHNLFDVWLSIESILHTYTNFSG